MDAVAVGALAAVVFGWFTPPPPFKAFCSATSSDKSSTPCESTGSKRLSTKSLTCLGDSNLSAVSNDCSESLSPASLLEVEELSLEGLLSPSAKKTLSSTDRCVVFSFSTNARLARCAFRRISLISSLSSSCRGACWTSTRLLFSWTTRACIADSKGSSAVSLVPDVAPLPVDRTRSRCSRIFFAFAITSAMESSGPVLSLFFLSLSFLVGFLLRITCSVGGTTGGGGGGGGTNAGGGGGGGGTNTCGNGKGGEACCTWAEPLPNCDLWTRLSTTGPWELILASLADVAALKASSRCVCDGDDGAWWSTKENLCAISATLFPRACGMWRLWKIKIQFAWVRINDKSACSQPVTMKNLFSDIRRITLYVNDIWKFSHNWTQPLPRTIWSNKSNTSDSVSSGYPNTKKRVENTTRSGVFLTKFEVFG